MRDLRAIADTPLCPTITQAGIRHVARNCDFIECTCEPECPDEAWWDRYATADAILAMHAALPKLLDIVDACRRMVDDHPFVLSGDDASMVAAWFIHEAKDALAALDTEDNQHTHDRTPVHECPGCNPHG